MQLNQAILCFWVDKIVSFIVLILYISHIFFLADYTFFPGLKYWILFALVAARRWWKTRSQSWNLSAVFLAIRQRCVWSKQEPVGHSPPTHAHHVFWDSDRQKMKTTPNCHILSTLANVKKQKTRARATLLYMQKSLPVIFFAILFRCKRQESLNWRCRSMFTMTPTSTWILTNEDR